MKRKKVTRIPDEVMESYSPEGSASTLAAERFEQQVVYILSALGEINENYKYAYVTDLSTFGCFDIDKKDLQFVSGELGFTLSPECKLVDIAEEMFRNNFQYDPSP
jgi:hypothetical protein|tara:strand:- start:354 stop:671 length:318 start_codon:yes stop_codon:yes gene_type:complete